MSYTPTRDIFPPGYSWDNMITTCMAPVTVVAGPTMTITDMNEYLSRYVEPKYRFKQVESRHRCLYCKSESQTADKCGNCGSVEYERL